VAKRAWSFSVLILSVLILLLVAATGCGNNPPPPPRALVVLVSPSTVWSGASTAITVFATNVAPPVAKVQIVPTGTTGPAIDLASVSAPADHADRPSALVPAGTAPGTYDVRLVDASGASGAPLASGLTVVQNTGIDLARVSPRFGGTASSTAVTIDSATVPFSQLPRVFLSKSGALIQLASVSRVTSTSLSAVVPEGQATGAYDVVVVDEENKRVGTLAGGFTVVSAPPAVASIAPNQVQTPGTGTAQVSIKGANFVGGSSGPPTATFKCKAPPSAANAYADQTVAAAPGWTSTALTVTIDTTRYNPTPSAAGITPVVLPGANCLIVVNNGDQTTAEFASLVVVTPSANLTNFVAGPPMTAGRRGLGAVSGELNQASRFLYAIGGDDSTAVRDDVEVLPVAQLGSPGTAGFFTQRYKLTSPRTQVGAVRIGRFIYVVGGSTAPLSAAPSTTNTLNTVERAALLDPAVRPKNLTVDLTLVPATQGGLGAGTYYYRVAALMPATDPFNPDGESLPSDVFGIVLPPVTGYNFRLKLSWGGVPGAVGYALYRSSGASPFGSEIRIADTTKALPANLACAGLPAAASCVDSGAAPPAGPPVSPLKPGSTSKWMTLAQTMTSRRSGPGVTFALDPDPAVSKAYLYVFGGKNESGAVLRSYESLALQLNADGTQTASPTGFSAGGALLQTGRWRMRAWTLPLASGTYVWAGGGFSDAAGTVASNETNGAKVATGGLLGVFQTDVTLPASAGFGAFAAGTFLYAVGGLGGAPDRTASSVDVNNPPALTGWNACQNCLAVDRVDLGAAIQSGYFYVLGGLTLPLTPATVTNTIEYTLY
jgi:hypothetical protein